jgi:hypothetical protein
MTELKYVKPERISLKSHAEFSEVWLQARIAEDPSIIGLGDLVLKDKERIHPSGGRLDLLLQDPESGKRYEVEVQLGRTDEAHVIRTIEYWDIERKRYPQYEHAAVLVAEDITSRFLNVVSLFNGFIPLIAIQLNAIRIDTQIALVCTRVLDELQLGLVDDDEEVSAPSDRGYWEVRGSRETLSLVDALMQDIRVIDPKLELKYNKYYIGLARGDQPDNFVVFQPTRGFLRLGIALDKAESTEQEIKAAGLDLMRYDARQGKYLIRLTKDDLSERRDALRELIKRASSG